MDYRNILTICLYCGTGCGLYLQVLDGEIVGVLPAKEHPVSQGKLCIKGWNATAFIAHQDRLTHSLIREGDTFREASWDEALGLVAERLLHIRDTYGPDALGFLVSARCTNEENYLLQELARHPIRSGHRLGPCERGRGESYGPVPTAARCGPSPSGGRNCWWRA